MIHDCACRIPSPSLPIRFSTGTITLSRAISHGMSLIMVGVRRTIFTPGVAVSTRNMLRPPRLPFERSVAATNCRKSASCALVIQRL